MGWGRFLLLGDLGQQFDLSDQKAEIQRQKTEMERLRDELRHGQSAAPDIAGELWRLRNENDELKLYVTALIRILISKGVITVDEFRGLVEAIDSEDGSVDGKYEGRVC